MRNAILVLITISLFSYCANWIAPYDPTSTNVEHALVSPGWKHLLGTDLLGRDVLSRLLFGGRRTLTIAFIGTVVAAIPGLLAGVATGYLDNELAAILRILINAMLAIPGLIFALAIMTTLGVGVLSVAFAIGIAQIAPMSQIVATTSQQARNMDFVLSARALGAGSLRIMRYHIFPTILPVFAAYTAVTFSYAILNGAALTFLGLGGDPGNPDWGVMLAEGRSIMQEAPWVSIAPGILIVITVIAANRLGNLKT